MRVLMFSLLMVLTIAATAANAQDTQRAPDTISLSGPRAGVTFLSQGVRDQIAEDFSQELGPVISQFGWQFEKRFLSSEHGGTAVTEWVVLFGGADQGVFIPSFTWLLGWRTVGGVEFGAGPNISPAGTAVAITGGVTFRAGNLNVPLNVAVVPSASGARVSMLVGFNARRR